MTCCCPLQISLSSPPSPYTPPLTLRPLLLHPKTHNLEELPSLFIQTPHACTCPHACMCRNPHTHINSTSAPHPRCPISLPLSSSVAPFLQPHTLTMAHEQLEALFSTISLRFCPVFPPKDKLRVLIVLCPAANRPRMLAHQKEERLLHHTHPHSIIREHIL